MKFSFNLTVDDWVSFQEYQKGKKTPFYTAIYPLLIVMSIGLVLLNVVYYSYYQTDKIISMTWISLACLLVLLFILNIRRESMKQLKKAGSDIQSKHPEAFGSMTLETNENGLEIQSDQTSKSLAWNEIQGYEENKNYFFLYSKKGVAYIIPKRGMKDQSEFMNILNYKVESN